MTTPPPPTVDEGRALTRVNLWRIFWVSAMVTYFAAQSQPVEASAAYLRLAAIALMCVLVYRGYRGALWGLGFFTALAGALMVIMAVSNTSLRLLDRTLFGVLGGVQVLAFLILLKAPEVKEFMRAQRERHAKGGSDAA